MRLILVLATQAIFACSLLIERYTFEFSTNVNPTVGTSEQNGLSFTVDVSELPPSVQSNRTSLEVVVSEIYMTKAGHSGGGIARMRMPLETQRSFGGPFFVIIGEDGSLSEVSYHVESKHLTREPWR